jgi:putative membrane protein
MPDLLPTTATPYCGPAPTPGTLAMAWNVDPVLIGLLTAGLLAGAWHLRGAQPGRRGALAGAGGAAAVAFVGPLCALTVALFAARTAHHLVVLLALAPALALAFPWRRAPVGGAFLALSVALWAWHLPAVYAAAWDSAAAYWALQGALVLPGWAFWAGVMARRQSFERALGASAMVAALAGQMGLIGAVLVFAPGVLYPEHLAGTAAFGLGALEDQQLAGLLMWVPGMLPMALIAGWLLRRAWAGLPAR